MLRTHTCGALNDKEIGKEVTLCGWVDAVRDHGGVTFIDLRDRYGKTQIIFDPALKGNISGALKSEDCILVRGKVQARPKGTENSKLPTGLIEVVAKESQILNSSSPLPFEVTKSGRMRSMSLPDAPLGALRTKCGRSPPG